MKNTLRRFPRAYAALRRLYRAVIPSPDPAFEVTRIIEQALSHLPDVFFVQIGSNDGLSGDPLYPLASRRRNWRGLLVEPVPFLFDRLQANYSHSKRLTFANVAIGPTDGEKTFYYVDPRAKAAIPALPPWYDQLNGFDRNHIIKHLGVCVEPFIIPARIPVVTLPALLADKAVNAVNLLHVDIEGGELMVLRQFDFDRYRPTVILYEHAHLSACDKSAAISLLSGVGYALSGHGGDTLAIANPC